DPGARRSLLSVGASSCTYPVIRAGLPATIAFGGTVLVTTAPAAIMAPEQTSIPGRIVAFAPIDAQRRIVVRRRDSGRALFLGKRSLAKVALGPMNTSSSRVTPSQSCTPHS